MNKQKEILLRPERSDTPFLADLLKSAFNARIGLIIVSIVALFMMMAVVALALRPQRVVVIDSSKGKTYAAASLSGITGDLLTRQLIYYSKQACEEYFSESFESIKSDRQGIIDVAHPEIVKALGQDWLTGPGIEKIITSKSESYFNWEINPSLTSTEDPYYTVFCVFNRTIKLNGITSEVRKYNVKVSWGRLANNTDFTKRPHSLVLTGINIISEGSQEYNEQINKLK